MIHKQNNFLKKIKSETSIAHKHIEQSYLTSGIVNQSILKSEYVDLLQRFLSFYHPCEAQLEAVDFWMRDFLEIEKRYKSHLLIKDLGLLKEQFLGIENVVMYTDIPVLNTDAQILGYLYVVEGATLGGQILSRQLISLFGFSQDTGAAFFSSYGKGQLGLMWKNFQHVLESFVEKFPSAENDIIESANLTFEKLDACLSEGL